MAFYQGKPDIIIRNGTIVDGTGGLPYFGDVAIEGDKIAYIGNLKDVKAPLEIDAHHKYVTPGFIDSHSHADFTMFACPEVPNDIRQGLTTEVVGNCGYSRRNYLQGIPFDPAGDGIISVFDCPQDGPFPKGSMAAVLDKMEAMGSSINTAWLCGHNDLRTIAGVTGPEPTPEQYEIMEGFLKEALEAGFIGFSTGLEFSPGIQSKPEEIERLAQLVVPYDGNYSTHMRDEGTYILEAINEFLNVIRKTGLRGTVSHLNVKYDNGIPDEYLFRGMKMLKDAREIEHLNVMCDMLPTCFAPGSAISITPPWLVENGWEKAREILADPVGRERVKNDLNRYWRFLGYGGWDRLLYLQPPYMPEISVTPFSEVVAAAGKEPVDVFLDIIAQAETLDEAKAVLMLGLVFREQTMIDSVVTDPIYMWMQDGHPTTEEPSAVRDRAGYMGTYMSFTYFFSHYVRDLNAIPIELAVQKCTGTPARHFRLEKRGILQVGNYADVNVFNIHDLKVNATFTDPYRYSSGMDYVIVNGTPVIAKGEPTHIRAGRVLRHLAAH